MVRGVRPLTDLAGEFTMMMANKHLDPGIETVFLDTVLDSSTAILRRYEAGTRNA